MSNKERDIFRKLTVALLDCDTYGVGYLLSALALSGVDVVDIKENFLSWLALETIANLPHNHKQIEGEPSITLISGAAAIVQYIKANINKALYPMQFVDNLAFLGKSLMYQFEGQEGNTENLFSTREIVDAVYTIAGEHSAEKNTTLSSVKFILFPAVTGETCGRVFLPTDNCNSSPWLVLYGTDKEPIELIVKKLLSIQVAFLKQKEQTRSIQTGVDKTLESAKETWSCGPSVEAGWTGRKNINKTNGIASILHTANCFFMDQTNRWEIAEV